VPHPPELPLGVSAGVSEAPAEGDPAPLPLRAAVEERENCAESEGAPLSDGAGEPVGCAGEGEGEGEAPRGGEGVGGGVAVEAPPGEGVAAPGAEREGGNVGVPEGLSLALPLREGDAQGDGEGVGAPLREGDAQGDGEGVGALLRETDAEGDTKAVPLGLGVPEKGAEALRLARGERVLVPEAGCGDGEGRELALGAAPLPVAPAEGVAPAPREALSDAVVNAEAVDVKEGTRVDSEEGVESGEGEVVGTAGVPEAQGVGEGAREGEAPPGGEPVAPAVAVVVAEGGGESVEVEDSVGFAVCALVGVHPEDGEGASEPVGGAGVAVREPPPRESDGCAEGEGVAEAGALPLALAVGAAGVGVGSALPVGAAAVPVPLPEPLAHVEGEVVGAPLPLRRTLEDAVGEPAPLAVGEPLTPPLGEPLRESPAEREAEREGSCEADGTDEVENVAAAGGEGVLVPVGAPGDALAAPPLPLGDGEGERGGEAVTLAVKDNALLALLLPEPPPGVPVGGAAVGVATVGEGVAAVEGVPPGLAGEGEVLLLPVAEPLGEGNAEGVAVPHDDAVGAPAEAVRRGAEGVGRALPEAGGVPVGGAGVAVAPPTSEGVGAAFVPVGVREPQELAVALAAGEREGLFAEAVGAEAVADQLGGAEGEDEALPAAREGEEVKDGALLVGAGEGVAVRAEGSEGEGVDDREAPAEALTIEGEGAPLAEGEPLVAPEGEGTLLADGEPLVAPEGEDEGDPPGDGLGAPVAVGEGVISAVGVEEPVAVATEGVGVPLAAAGVALRLPRAASEGVSAPEGEDRAGGEGETPPLRVPPGGTEGVEAVSGEAVGAPAEGVGAPRVGVGEPLNVAPGGGEGVPPPGVVALAHALADAHAVPLPEGSPPLALAEGVTPRAPVADAAPLALGARPEGEGDEVTVAVAAPVGVSGAVAVDAAESEAGGDAEEVALKLGAAEGVGAATVGVLSPRVGDGGEEGLGAAMVGVSEAEGVWVGGAAVALVLPVPSP
jgi:hypothetical protein